MSNNNYSSQRLSLPINNCHDSATSLSRTLSPVAFFHDGISTSEIDLRYNIIGTQRRAQAIATAPRRNRYYDDDEEEEDNEQKKTRLGYIKTPAVPIPIQTINQQTQSLPQTQSGISLSPCFRIDPPVREDNYELDYLFPQNSHRNLYSSAPLP